MKLQFHIHTRFSKDSILPLFILRWMCKLKKIDCVCITDHNEIVGAEEFKKRYETEQFKVIVGEEIFTDEGEIIGLFLRERIPEGLSPEETILRIRLQNGLVIVPHPYEIERAKTVLDEECIERNLKSIDAMEYFNGRNFKAEYGDAQNALCEKYKIRKILGSDAHTLFEIGYNTFSIEGDISRDSFLNDLASSVFEPKHMPRIVHFITKWHKLLKLLDGKRR